MEQKDKTRMRILQLAQQKFARAGYSGVSIADFASELRMSKSSFYKYYASKEALLFAVIDNFYESLERDIGQCLNDPELDIKGKLRQFLMLVRERFSSIQVAVVEDMRRSVPEAYEYIEERRKKIITEQLTGLFEDGAKQGYFRRDIAPNIVVLMLLNAMQQLEHPDFLIGTPYTFPDIFNQIFSLFMDGFLSLEGRKGDE
ncbi:TetR/AcrR family transcriptional regulator [Paenibacillus eucommiae]|uniref:AcrR family transcriptional regulator n=1 Tax=Paenibacillus eucommiae TaxID=1355755 RepID=A0ABS4JAE6_9BACL|nr:TetR/AcrR family transcriptional regulator [Paenibacillus eucommiae]MBP1996798.1 AcrR family transcriptional regulator [Paenibacillus eucommiae]